jgi:hypothetical protein
MNFIAIGIAALVPMIVGFIYYHPKVVGTAWMKACGLNEEKLKGGNMAVIFGVSLLLSFMMALVLQTIVIHQTSLNSLLSVQPDFKEAGSVSSELYNKMMELYGQSFRTFKHGVFHGVLFSLFFTLPVLGTNAMFERKGFKYIMINVVYWTITTALMGGIICAMP